MLRFVLLAALVTPSAFATINKKGVKAPTSRAEFCKNSQNMDYFKSLAYSTSNHLSFLNYGGLANGGVCWWHSMMTRNVQYLTVYRPELPKPNLEAAEKIIRQVANAQGVVEIPGYRNFYEFSLDFSRQIQSALEGWQIGDGVFGMGWIRGISGQTSLNPEELGQMMDDTYRALKKKGIIAYQMLQIKGIESHAWLVLDMVKTRDGYTLEVLDSNYEGVREVVYQRGMRQLSQYGAVPYTSRNSSDYRTYKYAIDQYCKYGASAEDFEENMDYFN